MEIIRPNQVWSSDITYIRLGIGFAYLAAVIDWFSRAVLAWRLSNTLSTDFCLEALREALAIYGLPEIFNTDQGAQFTAAEFIGELTKHHIGISMDGRGRCLDNIFIERLWRSVKHEDVYLNGYQTIPECRNGLTTYFQRYNKERPHQSLFIGIHYPLPFLTLTNHSTVFCSPCSKPALGVYRCTTDIAHPVYDILRKLWNILLFTQYLCQNKKKKRFCYNLHPLIML